MTVKRVNLGGRKFVILSEKDFRTLTRVKPSSRKAARGSARRSHVASTEDRADVALALKRLSDPEEVPIPYDQVRKELGLA